MERAQQLLVDDAQGVLDLGITPAVRKTVMVPPPWVRRVSGGIGRAATAMLSTGRR